MSVLRRQGSDGTPRRAPARRRSSINSPSAPPTTEPIGSLFDLSPTTDAGEYDKLVVTKLKQGSLGLDEKFDRNGMGVLHAACAAGNPQCVLVLLLHGCNPNLRDKRGITPIHEACFSVFAVGVEQSGIIFELLLMHGGSLYVKASDAHSNRWIGRMSAFELLHASSEAAPEVTDLCSAVMHLAEELPQDAIVCVHGFEEDSIIDTALNLANSVANETSACPRFCFVGAVTPVQLDVLDAVPAHSLVLQPQGQSLAQRIAFTQSKLFGLSGRTFIVAQEDVLPEVKAYFEALCISSSRSRLPDWLPKIGSIVYVQAKLTKIPTRRKEEAIGASEHRAQLLQNNFYKNAVDDMCKVFKNLSTAKYLPLRVSKPFIMDNLMARADRIDGAVDAQTSGFLSTTGDLSNLKELAIAAIDDSDTEESGDEDKIAGLMTSPTVRTLMSPTEEHRHQTLSPWGQELGSSPDKNAVRGSLHTSGQRQTVTIFHYNVAIQENLSRVTEPEFMADILSIIRRSQANFVSLSGVGTYFVDGKKLNFAESLAKELRCDFRYVRSKRHLGGTCSGVALLTPCPVLEKMVLKYSTPECCPSEVLAVRVSIDLSMSADNSVKSRQHSYVWLVVTEILGDDPKTHESQAKELIGFLKTIKTDCPLFLMGTFKFRKEERSRAYNIITSNIRGNMKDLLASHSTHVPSSGMENRLTYPCRTELHDPVEPKKRYDYIFYNRHRRLERNRLNFKVVGSTTLKHLTTTSTHLPVVARWIKL